MRRFYLKSIICLGTMMTMAAPAYGQYYDWGQDPASVKWELVKTRTGKYVFPEGYGKKASRLINYMDTVRPFAGQGFTHGPMKLPMLIHTQNFSSNGIVLQAPRRMEFIVTPPTASAAMPWDKQLVIHEYRHSVQYNNLNQGFIKALGWLIGQQGSMVGAALLPYWFLEGDAVLAETQMSSFGRGLQPSFTMDYRMFCLEGLEFSPERYISGSYRRPMPGAYEYGYQIVSYADTKYGHNIWDKVARYAARNPYFIFPHYFGLRKYYKTSPAKLHREAFDDLWEFWLSQPVVENSADMLDLPVKTYTTYSSPDFMPDGDWVAVFKEDLRNTNRIMTVYLEDQKETMLTRTGQVSSPLSVGGGKIYWTEYRQSTLWEQRMNSQLCYYDLDTGRKGIIPDERRVTFPVAMKDGSYAAVEYSYDGSYTIKHGDWRAEIPDSVSVHGLAYDREKFFFIGLSDAGMWIGSVSSWTPLEMITRPNHITIANLRAVEGKLYYNSIATGKDEVHMLELDSGKEYVLTESKYGSFSPAPSPDGTVVMTTFTKDGYLLSKRTSASPKREIAWSQLPKNTVNPPRRKWETINIDKITVADTTKYESRRYRRGLNLFQMHSWAPFYFDPDELVNDTELTLGIGATVMSQNLLNTAYSQLGYKYADGESHVRGKFNYHGWAPKIEVTADWSTKDQLDYRPYILNGFDQGYKMKDRFEIEASIYLPLLLSSGSHIRRLTPEISIEHNNGRMVSIKDTPQKIVLGPDGEPLAVSYVKYSNGMQKVTASIQYSDNVRLAYRDFLPRFGYLLRLSGSTNPFSSDFKQLYAAYGRLYLPGVAPHHSLMLRGTAQKMSGNGIYAFTSKDFFPRGADYDRIRPGSFSGFMVDYQLPLWYPDGGISSVVYFNRVRLNVGFDMAFYKVPGVLTPSLRDEKKRVWSYGGDVILDMALLGMPFNSQTTLKISIYKPSDRGVRFGAGITLPL